MFPHFKVRTVDVANILNVAQDRSKGGTAQVTSSSSTAVEEVLHLKSFCSMCGENTILVGGAVGDVFADMVNKKEGCPAAPAGSVVQSAPYRIVKLPDTAAANCLFLNVQEKQSGVWKGTIVRRAGSEFPASDKIFRAPGMIDPALTQIEMEAGELAKVDGALTCCSLLF